MSKVRVDISVSLDGFVAGPNPGPDAPLGEGGEGLHEWVFKLAAWHEAHGRSGGETGPDNDLVASMLDEYGAEIMGRGMFGGGPGPWPEDPPWNGWWGEDDPPFGHPVFVLTHHEREPLTLGTTTFHFVTEGIEAALDGAREAAGERSIRIGGGAKTIQQYLAAGLVDSMMLHIVPTLLGGGIRLFDNLGGPMGLERARLLDSPDATHIGYRVTGAPPGSG